MSNFKWYFGEENSRPTGTKDAAKQFYVSRPFESLVRESIQNSLDAHNPNNNDPIKVEFSFELLYSGGIESLFDIKTHIKECEEYWNNMDGSGTNFAKPMLDCFDQYGNSSSISCIRVSDYNTVGMDYKERGTGPSRFFGFVLSKGFSYKKGQGTGGSFGIGKAAYYSVSKPYTVLTSSKCIEDGSCAFMGVSLLATHKHDGTEVSNEGFFTDNNKREPITDIDKIPEHFRREEVGTDMYIVGYDSSKTKDYITTIKKSTLINFWASILNNNLTEVIKSDQFMDIAISKSNLQELIEQNFSGYKDNKRGSDAHNYNVRPYYEAVLYGHLNNEQYKLEEGEIDGLGKVKFYGMIHPDASCNIIYMRKPLMTVFRQNKRCKGRYAGVFICDNDEGNKLLIEAEGPAHNSWDVRDDQPNKDKVKTALQGIDDFIESCLKKWFPDTESNSTTMYGSEEYLSIINEEDDLPEDRISKNQLGKESRLTTTNETGNKSTTKGEKRKTKAKPRQSKKEITSDEHGDFIPGADGEDAVGHKKDEGEGGNPHPGPSPKPGTDTTPGKFTPQSDEKKYSVLRGISVSRVIAHVKNDKIHHSLIFNSTRDIEDAKLHFDVDTEDRSSLIEIKAAYLNNVSVPEENIKMNEIEHLQLNKGRNSIELEFFDSIKYDVNILSYELK